jgi:endonuclease YncB( thermonuclease family)
VDWRCRARLDTFRIQHSFKDGLMSNGSNVPPVLVRVSGQIDLSAYWPHGASDADTTTVELVVGNKSIEYSTDNGNTFHPTSAFEGATIKKKLVIRDRKQVGDRVVTIRLQGIDAPELHYRPQGLPSAKDPSLSAAKSALVRQFNQEYRQHFGEAATVKAADFLSGFANNGMVDCQVDTFVHEPNDVFDTYGRLIGDVFVGRGNNRQSLNQWLADNGWAFPTFYNSMQTSEIDAVLAGYKDAMKKKLGFTKSYQAKIGTLDVNLLYERPSATSPITFTPGADKGIVIMPKCFRRLVTLTAKNAVNGTKTDFATSVAADKFVALADFRLKGKSAKKQSFTAAFKSGKLTLAPEDLVFVEKPSTLIGPNGVKVTSW